MEQVTPEEFSHPAISEAVAAQVRRRLARFYETRKSVRAQQIELELCRRSVYHFFDWWPWTYDPKQALFGEDPSAEFVRGLPSFVPLQLFLRQTELVDFLEERVKLREDGLIEKSRDIGFTWIMGGYAWHKWRFVDGFKTTFGSRVTDLVDRIGDPDSIFEKVRMLMYNLPRWMMPAGFIRAEHDKSMLLINPANGNTIRGEGGDNMGRGGRSTLYVIDEAAHVPRAEKVEAATSANTDVRIWGSSVAGMDNFFARKRHGSTLQPRQIFRFHYSSDPRKTAAWVAKKKSSMEEWAWNSEYEIDYSASVEGIVIPAKWVQAAKELAGMIEVLPGDTGVMGGDIGGGGKARSVCVPRFGPVVMYPTSWSGGDTTDTAYRLLDECDKAMVERPDGWKCKIRSLRYENIGVGMGVQSTLKRAPNRPGLVVTGINTGNPASDTKWPDGKKANAKFMNIRAEMWWMMRDRFRKAFELWLFLKGAEKGVQHPVDEIIVLPPDRAGPEAQALSAQLSVLRSFISSTGKIQIESKDDDDLRKRYTGLLDHADGLALTFAPSKADQWAALAAA